MNYFIPCLVIKRKLFEFSLDTSNPLVISPEAYLKSRHHIKICKEQKEMFFCPSRCCVILKDSLSIKYHPELTIIPEKAYLSSGEIIRWRISVDIRSPNSLKPSDNEPLKNLFFVSLVNKFNVP
jgi:hypothetical protein